MWWPAVCTRASAFHVHIYVKVRNDCHLLITRPGPILCCWVLMREKCPARETQYISGWRGRNTVDARDDGFRLLLYYLLPFPPPCLLVSAGHHLAPAGWLIRRRRPHHRHPHEDREIPRQMMCLPCPLWRHFLVALCL